MSLVDSLRSRGNAVAARAMEKFFSDPRRVERLGEFANLVQRGRKSIDAAQEAALKAVGVASSGDVRAAGKRLAVLRRSARRLDDKLSELSSRLDRAE